MDPLSKLASHLIPALDVETFDQALQLADHMQGHCAMLKVGLKLYCKYGVRLLDALAEKGHSIFLDLKFCDIPNTVRGATRVVAEHPAVKLLTVHAVGGELMVRAAVEGVADVRSGEKANQLDVVAVTVLTSMGSVNDLGIDRSVHDWTMILACRALEGGATGLVSSGEEVACLRKGLGSHVILVTPGIRPGSLHDFPRDGRSVCRLPGNGSVEDDQSDADSIAKKALDDQTRVVTPAMALRSGSDFLVVGRPIYQASDPMDALIKLSEGL